MISIERIMKAIIRGIINCIKNESGASSVGGLALIICFLLFIPVFTSIADIYTTWRNLNEVAAATTGMAKKNGGFNDEVMTVYNQLLQDYKIDQSKLESIFYPGIMIKVNKREPLGIELRKEMSFRILQIDKSTLEFQFVIPIKHNTYSQRYFKPSQL